MGPCDWPEESSTLFFKNNSISVLISCGVVRRVSGSSTLKMGVRFLKAGGGPFPLRLLIVRYRCADWFALLLRVSDLIRER